MVGLDGAGREATKISVRTASGLQEVDRVDGSVELLTTASLAGIELAAIMRQGGHASTVALGYIRPVEQADRPNRRRALRHGLRALQE